MDEGGSKKDIKQTSDEGDPLSIISRFISDVRNVFSTIGVRCALQIYDGYHRLLLGSGCGVLFNFRLLLVGLYITYEILK
jgi:hypothetical protein